MRSGGHLEAVGTDVRYGFRLLLRSPTFTLFSVASLSLAIGATVTVFALFNSIVLRKLPVPEPDELVVASFGSGTTFNYSLPYPQFEEIWQSSSMLDGVFATSHLGRVSVAVRGEPQIADGLLASGEYYDTLRLSPALGRLLGPEDDRLGRAVAIISYAYWQRRFGGDPEVLGANVALNGIPFTIVGVEPEGFLGTELGRRYDLVMPLHVVDRLGERPAPWDGAFATWLQVMGRLRRGVALLQAESEAKRLFRQTSIAAADSPSQRRLATESTLQLEPGALGGLSGLREGHGQWLRLMLLLVAAVLALASLNVAALLTSRWEERRRESTIRMALGASRWRVVRQLLVEPLLIAAAAAGLGFLFANWASRVLIQVALPAAEQMPIDLTMDSRVTGFTVLVSLLACALFGTISALFTTSSGPQWMADRVGRGPRQRMLDRILIASQVALSLVLLGIAGLFVRTLGNAWTVDTGYERKEVLLFSVDARLLGQRGAGASQVYRRLLEELGSAPGVRSVSASAVRPVGGGRYLATSVKQLGDRVLPEGEYIPVALNHVAPGYFNTLGIHLVAGRAFETRDSLNAARVVIVSERMARHFEGPPVGQLIGTGSAPHEIVGVVRDVRHGSVRDPPREVLYYPIFQSETPSFEPTFVVRYSGPRPQVLRSMRDQVASIDPGLAMFAVNTLETQTWASLSKERLLAMLTSYFGGFALLLACIGLYGLVAHTVEQRRSEIGLRMALGARARAVQLQFILDAARTILAGTALGLIGSFAAVRLLRAQLFATEPQEVTTVAVATMVLLTAAFAAACVPAHRASRTDPVAALRHD